MILVIVAMGIILFLGASLLYATYTAYMIRNTERQSEDVFSSADTGMDLLRNRLTEVESKAAEKGYADVLNLYTNSQYDQVQFKKSFVAGLHDIGVASDGKITDSSVGGSTALFPGGTSDQITGYSVDALQRLFRGKTAANGDTYELTGSGQVYQATDGSLLLKDISLKYNRKKGDYQTSVTTDVRLHVPDITASAPKYGFGDNELEEFSCIADQGFIIYRNSDLNGDSSYAGDIAGSLYAGMVETRNNAITIADGKRLIVGKTRIRSSVDDDGTVHFTNNYTSGNIWSNNKNYANIGGEQSTKDSIANTTKNGIIRGGIKIGNNSTLWTNDINLLYNASLDTGVGSHVYVADDLNLGEGGASATIRGDYIGFGNGDTPDSSSSIVFNNRSENKSLDLTNATSLILAGRSFIMEKDDGSSTNLGMGSSITAKPEQLAYLVPTGDNSVLGDIKNPRVVSEKDAGKVPTDVAQKISEHKNDKVYNMTESLASYGIDDGSDIVSLSYKRSDDTYMQYYFFRFNDKSMANAYFKDYFESNADSINDYLKSYADIKGLDSSKIISSATGLDKPGDEYTVSDAATGTNAENLDKTSEEYKKEYRNLSQTLNERKSDSESTPFYSLVDTVKLHKLCEGKKDQLVPVAWWGDNQNNYWYCEPDKRFQGVTPKPGADQTPYDDTNPLMMESSKNRILLVVGKTYYNRQTGKPETIKESGPDQGGDVAGYAAVCSKGRTLTVIHSGELVNFYVVDGDMELDLQHNFDGIIMCSGTVRAGSGHFVLQSIGAKAFKKTHIYKGNSDNSGKNANEDWSLDKMVVYENWRKNG